MKIWEYGLTAQEEAICVKIGYQRQEPYFGDPSRNINYAEGDLWEMWQHAICAGSELAFARMMGKMDFVPHVNKWKTELDIPGVGEIRYSFNPNGGMRFTTRDNPDLKYVLMIDGMAIRNRTGKKQERRSTPYKAIGWLYGHECMKDEYLSQYNNKTWIVPQNKLKAMPSHIKPVD